MSDDFKWPEDGLGDFLQTAESGTRHVATHPDYATEYHYLSLINDLSALLLQADLRSDAASVLTRTMLSRFRGAYFGAARLIMGGQIPEAYMVARGALEAGLFGYIVFRSPDLERVWSNRHDSIETVNECRDAFTASKAFRLLKPPAVTDPYIENDLRYLYDDLIDHGGHPNVGAVKPHSREEKYIERIEGNTATVVTRGSVLFINYDAITHHRCVRRVVQTGIGVLRLYEMIDPQFFRDNGLDKHVVEATQVLWREEIHHVKPPRR